MSTNTLTVVAMIKASPGKEEEMRRELMSLVEASRKDEGCVNYDLHQSVEDPTLFFFHENWASKELWDLHMRSPQLNDVLDRATRLVDELPEITLWKRISPDRT